MDWLGRIGPIVELSSMEYGTWSLTIQAGPSAKNFNHEYVAVIVAELAANEKDCECLTHELVCHGIDRISEKYSLIAARKLSPQNSRAYINLESQVIMVDPSPERVNSYVASYLESERIKVKIQKLSTRADGLRRIFVLNIGSGSDDHVAHHLRTESILEYLPSRTLVLPKSIDVFAVAAIEVGSMLILEQCSGWQAYSAPKSAWQDKLRREFDFLWNVESAR
jgi:hypothetical protein